MTSLKSVPEVEQIEYTVCVDPYGPPGRRRVRRVSHGVGQLANRRGRHLVLFVRFFFTAAVGSGLAAQAAAALPVAARGRDAVGNVDARLGSVAGLARVAGTQAGVLLGIVVVVVAASLALVRVLQRGAPRGVGLLVAGLRGRVGLGGGGVPRLGRGVAGLGLEGVDLHGFGGLGLGRRGGSCCGGGGGGGSSSGPSLAFVAAGPGW